MESATQRLRSLQSEADKCSWQDFDIDEGPILNDEQVARLLLGVPAAVVPSVEESDALEAMRGLLAGTAWAVPVWGLIAATLVLT